MLPYFVHNLPEARSLSYSSTHTLGQRAVCFEFDL
jgi:hypothetical protein